MTRRKDGQWRALSNEEIYNHKMFLGQIYRNELALNLRGLGYAIESDNKGLFEVQGIEQRLLDHFSRRSTQIDEKVKELKEGGLYTQAGDQKLREIAALGSRVAKQNPDMELVKRSWENRLQEQGYNKKDILQAVKEAHETARLAEFKRTEPRQNSYDYIRLATQAKTEQESVFTKEEILNAAAKLAMGEKHIEDLDKAFQEFARTRAIITLDKEKGLYTTREMLKIEKEVVKRVSNGHGQLKSIMKSEEEAVKVISEKYDHLTQGQKDAAVHILFSRDRVIGIQGDAGTGKTTMLKAAGEELESHGHRVYGLSYTGKAAAEIESNSGIKSQTLHSFLGVLESGGMKTGLNSDHKGEVWVVDEASMLGSRQIHELIRNGEKADARIVLLGDDKQLQAVEAGKMFSKLQENGALKTVRMTEILRQTDHGYRDIIKDLSGKKIDAAFNKLETQGRIYEISDRHERLEAIIRDYLGRDRHKDAIIVTARNQDRHELNSAIRDELKLQGRLPQENYVFTVRESLNISPSDKLFAQGYHLDDLLIANKSGIIGRAGTEAKIVSIDTYNHTLTVQTKNQKEHLIDLKTSGLHLAAYAEKHQTFSQSDKVVVLKNDKGLKVQNGMTGEVKSVDEKGNINIKLDNGRDLRFNLKINPLTLVNTGKANFHVKWCPPETGMSH